MKLHNYPEVRITIGDIMCTPGKKKPSKKKNI